jgi:O-antigen/teichoic acid export membrane protein
VLDNTNRTSLGIGQGAVQEIPLLRAQGRFAAAERLASIAHTTNTVTCLLYSISLVIWAVLTIPTRAGDSLAAHWTCGLLAVAILALLKRRESFLVALLRCHQDFTTTTKADLLEAVISAVAMTAGVAVAGLAGLWLSIALVLLVKIAYLSSVHPLPLAWCWDWRETKRLFWHGLPIVLSAAVWGAMIGLDRVFILHLSPEKARAAGLYTVAILGTSWSLDLAGRLALVLHPHFLSTLGRSGNDREIAVDAARTTELLAAALAILGAFTYLFGPTILFLLIPKYADGVPSLRPLIPGAIAIGLCWPLRQMLTALRWHARLVLIPAAAVPLLAWSVATGLHHAGLPGAAWGASATFLAVFLVLELASLGLTLPARDWLRHTARLSALALLATTATLALQNLGSIP